jgi:hypothetical protein
VDSHLITGSIAAVAEAAGSAINALVRIAAALSGCCTSALRRLYSLSRCHWTKRDDDSRDGKKRENNLFHLFLLSFYFEKRIHLPPERADLTSGR